MFLGDSYVNVTFMLSGVTLTRGFTVYAVVGAKPNWVFLNIQMNIWGYYSMKPTTTLLSLFV